MKILYTHRTQGVGAEGAHILGMFEAFRDLNHNVHMDCLPGCNPMLQKPASRGNQKPPSPSLLQRIYWAIADHAPPFIFTGFEFAYNLPLALRFFWKCLTFRPQLVYERYSLNTFAPSLICSLLKISHVLEVNDAVVIERSRPLSLKALASFSENYCLKKSTLIITITDKFRGLLTNHYSLSAQKVMVLTNAISRKRFSGPFQREKIRRELGINQGFVIGGTGQFLSWHGLHLLVAALGKACTEKNLYFLFVGDGPARQEVEAIARDQKISDRVFFSGMLSIAEVPDYLSALDLAVIPSAAKHASPMKLIEYMAMGLPIIAPDFPSIRAAFGPETLAAIFPGGDMEEMEKLILKAVDNPSEANNLALHAKKYVFENLTWHSHAEKILQSLRLS